MRCDECKFFDCSETKRSNLDAQKDDVIGKCRRYPPTLCEHAVQRELEYKSEDEEILAVADNWGIYWQPYVTADAWCGEFQAK